MERTSSHSTIVRCVLCGHGIRVALAIGQMLKCPSCGTTFLAPDDEHNEPDQPAASAASPPIELGTPDPSQVTRSTPLLEIPLAAGAGPVAGPPCHSTPDDEEPEAEDAEGRGRVAVRVGVVMALVLAVAGSFAWVNWRDEPWGGRPRTQAQSDGDNESPPQTERTVWTGEIPFPVRYSDSSSRAQRIGGVRVFIEDVAFAPVVAKTDSNEVVQTEGESFLTIRLLIENRSTRPVSYQSWYGGRFAFRQWWLTARLVDNLGRQWPLVIFDDAKSIRFHTESADLAPRDRITDVLVFEPPSPAALEETESWKLFLPSLAIGYNGGFGFLIEANQVNTNPL